MSNHFTGLSLGPPLGDQRLDLCDLYAFQSPQDPSRTVLILNANPQADALHPDAIYRLAIDNDGDLPERYCLQFRVLEAAGWKADVSVFVAKGTKPGPSRRSAPRSSPMPRCPSAPSPTSLKRAITPSLPAARSDAFFFDFDGIKNLFDTSGRAKLHRAASRRQVSVDRRRLEYRSQRFLDRRRVAHRANSAAIPTIHIWGRCSVRKDGKLRARRSRRPPVRQQLLQYRRDEAEYNASEPVNDHKRWIDLFVHLMGHTGGYTREEASRPSRSKACCPICSASIRRSPQYPNGRVFTDDVINYRLAFLSKGDFRPRASRRTPTRCRFPVSRYASRAELRTRAVLNAPVSSPY